ncbi:MAG: S1C family serine protease [Myxococcota bacterium]
MLSLCLLASLSAAPLPLEQLFPKVDPAVVTVRVGTKSFSESESGAVMAVSIVTGSGVLVHGDGYVVTAAHVVESADAVQVLWADGFKADATVVSLSRTEDLALLKVAAVPAKATVAVLGDSAALRPGMRLFAIGAPYGLDHTLTAGVVSALRSNERRGLLPRHLLQTDVPINQGNSGGPLFNERGEVVGIASFMLSQSGGSVGLNFAVPSNTVRARLFDEALPYIGVSLRFIPKDVAELFNWPVDAGFLVEAVRPASAAEKAGLRGGSVPSEVGGNRVQLGGDLIVSVNGVPASETTKVAAVLRALKAGELIRYEVLRAGRGGVVEVPVPAGLSVPSLPKR